MADHELDKHNISDPKILRTKMYVRDIHNLIRDVNRCQSWSRLAAIDIKRNDIFQYRPVWCIDFSEIRVFLEKNEQQPTALHLIDYFASGKDKDLNDELVILPGTVFEILSFLDYLIRRSSSRRRPLRFEEFRNTLLEAPDHKIAGQLILEFITEHSEKQIGDSIDLLKKSEPTVLRLQFLLESKHVKFFHRSYGDQARNLPWFPGYFEKVYQELHNRRDKFTINNYNDALNITLCYILNENKIGHDNQYFVYVTRDRACMETAIQSSWLGDPMRNVDPLEKIPLCREPYSVFLYYGEKKGKENLAHDLSVGCLDFANQLKELPEYLQAIKEAKDKSGSLEDTLIEFQVDTDERHKKLSETLTRLMEDYGALLYKAIEESDYQKLSVLESDRSTLLRLGDFPQRQLVFGTKSLEKLTAALGLVYREVATQKEGASFLVQTILHKKTTDSAINVLEDFDPDFDSRACTLKTIIGREAVICIIEFYKESTEDFYYSSWWSSAANVSLFTDVVNYYWSTIRKFELEMSSSDEAVLLDDEEKVFATGITLSVPKIVDKHIEEDIISETISDMMPLSDSSDLLKSYIERYTPSSIRINTRAGDIWFNFTTSSNTVPRMGIISHLWQPTLLAKMIAFTSKHYVAISDLEKKLKEIKG